MKEKVSYGCSLCWFLYLNKQKMLLSATSTNLKVNDLNNNNDIYTVLCNIWNVLSFDIMMSSISSILRGS